MMISVQPVIHNRNIVSWLTGDKKTQLKQTNASQTRKFYKLWDIGRRCAGQISIPAAKRNGSLRTVFWCICNNIVHHDTMNMEIVMGGVEHCANQIFTHPNISQYKRLLYLSHIVLNLRSLIWGFDESCTIVHCIISQPTGSKMCSVDIFVNLQLVG